MQRFMIQANYTVEGLKGLLKDGGSGRKAAIQKVIESVGGKVESVYFAFGKTDVFVILEMPDNASMTAVALTAGATGAVAINTVVLMTPEEVDEAVKKHPAYRAPGQ